MMNSNQIQKIIEGRLSGILHEITLFPYISAIHEQNIEFLLWISRKFPREYQKARWAVIKEFPFTSKERRSLEESCKDKK